MSEAATRAGAAAVQAVVDRMAAIVAANGGSVSAEPVDGGLRLSGPRLRIALVADARLRALAAQAAGTAR